LFIGKDGIITENDPIEQEKRVKYLDLVASAVILQNAFDMSTAIQALSREDTQLIKEIATLSVAACKHNWSARNHVNFWLTLTATENVLWLELTATGLKLTATGSQPSNWAQVNCN
jgi:ABC-type uncharacterized transport system permease subunit